MTVRIRISGLVLAIAMAAALPAGVSPGAVADDPCGGHYVGEGLKAVFSGSYSEGDLLYESSIFNDIPNYLYTYRVPDGDCVFYFRAGHVALTVDRLRNGRFVNMLFDGERKVPTGTSCAPNPYFLDPDVPGEIWPRRFFFRTSGGYTWSRDGDGKLILKGTGINLDLGAMTPGQTAYCDTWLNFGIMDDPITVYDEAADQYTCAGKQVKVFYGLVDGSLKWVIRPIAEPYTVRTETKVKKTVVVTETSYSDALFRTVWSNGLSSCEHGTFYFPFELVFERLN